jgi:hypothetical protein
MTYHDFPVGCNLRTNPNRTPSFKKGDYVVLKKDCIDPGDPEGPTSFLIKGYIFIIEQCGYSEYVFSPPKFTSKGEFLEKRKPIRSLNDIEWCIVDFETDFFTGAMVKAENCRLATEEDLENEEA